MLELFQYDFFKNAVYASLLVSISCGFIGTYIVTRRLVFIAGGISHIAFGGVGIAYFFGWNPVNGALIVSVLSALGIGITKEKTEIREDSMIGILWSLGMAVGIIFMTIKPGYAPNLMTYLFGNILTISISHVYILLLFTIISSMFFILLYPEITAIAFQEDFARTQKIPVTIISNAALVIVAISIVLYIRIIGNILVIAMLTVPQSMAMLYFKSYKKIILFSIIFAILSSFLGFIISYYTNIPSGATIVTSSVVLYLLLFLIKKLYQRKR